ncbi:MAG: UDP-N-acetylmuramoyl-tripeptide--D-alanyl-D-alanine ligase [Nitrospirae bacterium]|nr:MAG: UDP-N-acetylmuramoyl-tripeptide--D-alanyl-D-alanine ligase [Nitrospirota bacterium]
MRITRSWEISACRLTTESSLGKLSSAWARGPNSPVDRSVKLRKESVLEKMASFSLAELLEVTGGCVLGKGVLAGRVMGVSTDSRTIRAGELFVALSGTRFDGHQFVGKAFQRGARGAIIAETARHRVLRRLQCDGYLGQNSFPLLIQVPDPLAAYQALAAYHRMRIRQPVVAVTGSNGKTTTKEMTATLLQSCWPVLKTPGNFNNSIGLPATILRMSHRYQVTVVEMGVDQVGQTTRLCEIARPTMGVITNIGPDHLEFFGDLEGSATAKAELLACLPSDGVIVLNADDPYFPRLNAQARCRTVTFGFTPKAQIRGSHVGFDGKQTIFHVQVPGRKRSCRVAIQAHGSHNVSNALAAMAVGYELGVPLRQMIDTLARFRPAAMRSELKVWRGITFLHDCYNANPASMKAAIDTLVDLNMSGQTMAVLGDMLELGPQARRLHREVGAYVAARAVDYLVAYGKMAKAFLAGAREAGMSRARLAWVTNAGEAAQIIASQMRKGDVVLLKASRGIHMEHVLEVLKREKGVER